MSAPRPYETDPFHPLGSIWNIKQFLYICKSLPVISSMWYAQLCIHDNCACAFAGTVKLRFRAFFKVIIILFFLGYMLVRIDTTFTAPGKGYSLCKMVSLCQKFKLSTDMQKTTLEQR